MRILSLIAVVVFLSALAPQALAGTVEDCVRELNPNPQIGDCTAAILGKVLESGFLYLGTPAMHKRALTEREIEYLSYVAEHYILLTQDY